MSKISQYVNLHRKSRTTFMSISDFNKKFDASLPENKVAETAFHADVRRKRRMMFPLRGSLYPLARELGLQESVPSVSTKKSSRFSMRPRRSRVSAVSTKVSSPVSSSSVLCNHKSGNCSCNDEDKDKASVPVRRLGMKLNNISISRPKVTPPRPEIPSVMKAKDSNPHMNHARKHTVAQGGHSAKSRSKGKQRNGNRHPSGKGHMNKNKAVSVGENIKVQAIDNHDTFTSVDAKNFYEKHMPEFLKSHDISEVVSNWNKAPLNVLMTSIRNKYGIAPKDLWSVSDVKSYYEHYDPDFLQHNEVHAVMTDWISVEPSILRSLLSEKYGSCPGEPFIKVNWTPAIVTEYYTRVFPAKLQQETPEEIVSDWNKHSVETVMNACKSRYGVAPIPQGYEAPSELPSEDNVIDRYKRALEESGEHFDATKILHFVDINGSFGDFSSSASKLKSSTARFLIDGIKGPYKMFNNEYVTFKSISSEDVNNVMRAIKNNRSGDFFIRVEHE